MDDIMKIQELAFDHILKKLEVHYSGPIRIYIYNKQTASRALVKAGATGIAHPELESVEAIYSPKLKSIGRDGVAAHEMTHVIASVTLSPSHVKILSEGLAVYMDDYWRNNLHDITDLHVWADLYLNNSELPSVNDLIHHWDDYESYMTYPVSGSYVKFIFERYGYEKFMNLYLHADKHNIDELTANIYGISIDSLEAQWHHEIVSYTNHNIRFY